ncbi:poly-beta-1,6-N-acetyl-D-glucosamine synthase [Sphingobium aromaticiconvertens]|uniref:poly-beta-1,6-N-acetyl-D-glucosamine synthase n=1 Tax=Sphingobium aromaticiconvertens TaxID=365341 RepID=UPI00301588CA
MIERLGALAVFLLMVGGITGIAFVTNGGFLLDFVFLYPLFMSALWMAGGIYYWLHWERHWPQHESAPELPGTPLISIIIPCFNEEKQIEETIGAALAQAYLNIEVIAVNDGSRDATGEILDRLAASNKKLRVIHLAENQGKAVALRTGALAAASEYLVCIDGDAMLEPNAAAWLVKPMLEQPRVGAVTGNPRIRNRSSLLGRVQVGEFASIIGLIKRTQRVYGRIFTVSGVVAGFRRQALDRVGYWSLDMITEDIDISWKLQRDHWAIFYEPRALCWILMPETLRGLWRQRSRWAQGGAEVFLKFLTSLLKWRQRRLWPLAIEYLLSSSWAFIFALTIILWALGKFYPLPTGIRVETLLPPAFTGMVLAATCVLQFAVSILIERRYERGLGRTLYWVIWYPAIYWMLSLLTTLASYPKVFIKTNRGRARWTSPDRGLHQ